MKKRLLEGRNNAFLKGVQTPFSTLLERRYYAKWELQGVITPFQMALKHEIERGYNALFKSVITPFQNLANASEIC